MVLERAGQILDCTLRNARVLSPISVGMYVLHPTRPNGRVRKEFGTLTRRHRALRMSIDCCVCAPHTALFS